MRKFIVLGLLVVAFLFGATDSAVAQQKLGYINSEAILAKMPAVKNARSQLEALGKQLQKQYDAKAQKFQAKYQKGIEDAQKGILSPAQQKALEEELAKMQSDIQAFQKKSQDDLLKKENELLEPVFKKVNDTITEVAKANGYTHVVNENLLIYKEGGSNIAPLVAKKLGITL